MVLVDVFKVFSLDSFPPRLWSRTWTFQFLMVVIASVVVFSVYTQERDQQRFVEQSIFLKRLPSRSWTFQFRLVTEFFILHRRLLVCWVWQIKGFFALFPVGKSARSGPHPGSELGADFTSSTPLAQPEGFFWDADGYWMEFPGGWW